MYDDRVVNAATPPDPPGDSPPVSESHKRFLSCRWRKPSDNGQPAHCTHREVLPMAGIHGFSPDSWCADCAYFKLRRVPRKDGFSRGTGDIIP